MGQINDFESFCDNLTAYRNAVVRRNAVGIKHGNRCGRAQRMFKRAARIIVYIRWFGGNAWNIAGIGIRIFNMDNGAIVPERMNRFMVMNKQRAPGYYLKQQQRCSQPTHTRPHTHQRIQFENCREQVV